MSSLQAESRIPIVPLFVSLAFQPAKGLDFPMLDPWTGVPNMCLKLLTSQRGSPLLSSVESPPWVPNKVLYSQGYVLSSSHEQM